ncbi:hypothetical protein KCU90_g4224, partial [Aureobasidium melanogenum]
MRGENHFGHRHPGSEAFLRTAEDDRDLVGAVEAEPLADHDRHGQREGEQHNADQHQSAERGQRDLVPQAFVHGLAECSVHHQQDRALVDELQHAAVALDPLADQRAQQLSGHERHQQLQNDVAYRMPRRGAAACRLIGDNEADERGRDEDAQQARGRRAAYGGRYVAFGNRGERDRRLNRRRQRAEEEDPRIERRRDKWRKERLKRETEQREQRERAEQYDQMQTPMRRARYDRLA